MRKTCIIFFILAISLLISVGCRNNHTQSEGVRITTATSSGLTWVRRSIDELVFGATHIVRAEVMNYYRVELINTVLSDRELRDDEVERVILPHTVHQLRVLEVFMGNVAVGDIVEVAQQGGRIGNRELINESQIHLTYGDELIFFLHCYETHGFRPQPMELESYNQAIYWPAPPGSDHETVLENFSPENELVLTIGDLERIAQESGLRPTPRPPSRPPASNNTGSGQESEEEPRESTPQPSPQATPTPSPSPIPASEGDEIEDDTPRILLRFVI